MRALVTGAAGFIGSSLVDRLLAGGYQVIAVDNLSSGSIANLEPAHAYCASGGGRLSFIHLDIQAPELGDVVEGCNPDVVFHLAAQVDPQAAMTDPQFDARSNVAGTINVCEAIRRAGVRRIVYAGADEPAWGTLTPHGAAKMAGDLYLRAYASAFDIDPVTLLLGSVYGPRQSDCGGVGLLAVLGGGVATARPAAVDETDLDGWDLVYIDDVVEAFLRAAELPVGAAGRHRISSGRRISLAELRSLTAAVLPEVIASGAAGKHYSSAGGATPPVENGLLWSPSVPLETGILRTICWIRAGVDVVEQETA